MFGYNAETYATLNQAQKKKEADERLARYLAYQRKYLGDQPMTTFADRSATIYNAPSISNAAQSSTTTTLNK